MAKQIMDLLTLDNDVLTSYMFWCGILVLKMYLVTALTGLQRFTTHTFANPEDVLYAKAKVKFDNPNVERVRRAHLNDLENILPFFTMGFLYILIDPPKTMAIIFFRVVGISRIVHTVVYAIFVIPQPARLIAFLVGLAPTVYMAFSVIIFLF